MPGEIPRRASQWIFAGRFVADYTRAVAGGTAARVGFKFGDEVIRNEIAELAEEGELGARWWRACVFFHPCRVADHPASASPFPFILWNGCETIMKLPIYILALLAVVSVHAQSGKSYTIGLVAKSQGNPVFQAARVGAAGTRASGR